MSIKQFLPGFLPWIVFSLVSTRVGPGAVGMAALLAMGVAAAVVVGSLVRGQSPKLIPVTAGVSFAAMGAWAIAFPASDAFLALYGRGVIGLVLAAVMAVSLVTRPFTEQFARASVPAQFWDSPQFHATNRRISAAWAGAVAVMGVGHVISGALDANAADYAGYLIVRPGELLLNWIIPALALYAAYRYTRRVLDGVHHSAALVTR
ncbi:hypothetical protein [Actinomycetospora flava]|uniref:DUF3159 domain-containing protein n=1 Tax=Actinomycetospora flava TaxID=3129232 RepID=A0ABU8MEW8_9PSEU